MPPHDEKITAWRQRLADGNDDVCTNIETLKPDSFCVVLSVCWGGPGGCMMSMLAPEYFDDESDFVAYVRAVEIPRSLHIMLFSEGPVNEAEKYLPLTDAETRLLLERLIAVTDAALLQDKVTRQSAADVIDAFNALFGRNSDVQFVASGDVAAVIECESIVDHIVGDTYCVRPDDGAEEIEIDVVELVESGRFDPLDELHFKAAQYSLASFPRC
jgi:hypothetical protein